LTIIRGELESLVQMPSLPAAVTDGIGSALEESNRMAKIVNSLMTISRLDCGGEQIEHAPVDLVEVVAVTLDHMSLLAEEKHISLRFESGAAIYVTGDSMRLKQIVVNLVDNAIKYTPDGGDVSVFVTAEQKKAILKVTDTGIGIPAASLPLVFNRFYRADQARSRESGGTGLGLSIVRAICDVHGGEAFVESIDGRGTTFRIELPLLSLTATQVVQLRAATFIELSPNGPAKSPGATKVVSTRNS
jgi:signal transduction histidine kinase